VLRVAGELPHPVVQVVGHGDAGNDAGEVDSGGRSSDGVGFDATVHGRRSWWWLQAPGAALSTTVSLASSHCVSSHDGAMAGGGELSGAVEVATTEAKRARELGEEEEEIIAGAERGLASSGRSWRRRIDRRRLGCPRLKTRAKMAFGGVWSRVGQRRGPERQGGAIGLVGGARGWLW